MLAGVLTCSECGGDIEVIGVADTDAISLLALIPFHDCERPTIPVARGGHGEHP